jgi:manganese-dependent inorganic pyrophosphatase
LPLADLALEPFAQTLLERRTQIGDAPMTELLVADEKAYQIAGYKLYVSQICVMDPAPIHTRQTELAQAMQDRLEQDELDAYVLMLTDLAKGGSLLYFASNGILPEQPTHLAGAVSRKKEALPWLSQYLSSDPV